jgi:hypothetical protein
MTRYTEKVLDEVRAKLAASDQVLQAARDRRGLVLDAAMGFEFALRPYNSGSIAHWTANSDLDADCGVVLDRRKYQGLGPDGDGIGPNEVVEQVADLVRSALPGSNVDTSKKRAITVEFGQPVEGEDPSVDLIVGLDRREKPGLWIPNLWRQRWDPSHPERHTELFLGQPTPVRRVWARAVRLAKGWNTSSAFDKPGLSSFNLETLAWMRMEKGMSQAQALAEVFAFGARSLVNDNRTPDPAEVSPPIKLSLDWQIVVARLNEAAKRMDSALEHDDDEAAVREALAPLFPDQLDERGQPKEDWTSALRRNKPFSVGRSGVQAGAVAAADAVKTDVRSWVNGSAR